MNGKYSMYAILILSLGLVWGVSFGEYEDEHLSRFWEPQPGVAPVTDPKYKEECGTCHFAYQPGLLPQQSWQKIMAGLENHFGDNAELNTDTNREILQYLTANSADKVEFRRSRRIMLSIASLPAAPMRITDIPYIRHQHNEIPQRMISGNKKVVSLSHCDACHQNVQTGSFSERHIRIPGFGRWDD